MNSEKWKEKNWIKVYGSLDLRKDSSDLHKVIEDLHKVIEDLHKVIEDLCKVVEDLCKVVEDLCKVVEDLCKVIKDLLKRKNILLLLLPRYFIVKTKINWVFWLAFSPQPPQGESFGSS